jgi:hypothetical protein
MGKLDTKVPADRIKFMVVQLGPPSARALDSADKGRNRILNTIVTKAIPKYAFIETAIMGNQKIIAYEFLQDRPDILKRRSRCYIPIGNTMDTGKGRKDFHSRWWLYKGIEGFINLAFPHPDQTHGTGTGTLITGCLEIYGTKTTITISHIHKNQCSRNKHRVANQIVRVLKYSNK